jgi:predicted GIY-YIG superfamily endonuclease
VAGRWVLYEIECVTPRHWYVGISADVDHRLIAHKAGSGARFTAKYGVKSHTVLGEFVDAHTAKQAERRRVLELRAQGSVVAGAGWTQTRKVCKERK